MEMPTILNLPIHPLAVHAPIILVALLVLGGLAYLLIAPLRQRIGWAVAALVLISPLTVYGSVLSGEMFADFTFGAGKWTDAVETHQNYGWWLLWTLVALVPVWFLFAALDRGRRAARQRNGSAPAPAADEDGETPAGSDDPAATGRKIIMFILGLLAFALLALAAYLLFKSGHSGADMVWGGTVQE
jgi:uncharacterized membrane protein